MNVTEAQLAIMWPKLAKKEGHKKILPKMEPQPKNYPAGYVSHAKRRAVEIIDIMTERGEITVKEVEHHFGIQHWMAQEAMYAAQDMRKISREKRGSRYYYTFAKDENK